MTTTLPAGWKLVPERPTKAMQDAWDSAPFNEDTDAEFREAYDAMIEAAPAAPASAQEEAKDERQAFEAWLASRGVWPALCFEEVFIAGWNARPADAPAAGDALDAARWRFVRRKLCLTGNGDGTCAMHAINLPASIPGWPEPGDAVAEFCDAAIDAAIAAQRKGDA